ncbi:MAG: DUF3352 domain-containing protein [Actinobacteria bacterium]|nr:DUF3352 domain-containing protein [Actinomycetota bacterium]
MSDVRTQTVGAPPGVPPGLVGTDDLPPGRPRRRRWIALALVSVLLVGGVAYGAMRLFSHADDHAIDLVPKRSLAYANVFLEPSTAQRRAIRDLLERFPVKTPERAQDLIANLLDEPLSEIGLQFERDVQPWLGDQIAGFALPPQSLEADLNGGVLIATTDEDATRVALEKYRRKNDLGTERSTYKDRDLEIDADGTVTGFLGSFLFVGTRAGFEAAADAEASGDSLEDSARYERAVRGLEEDRLAVGYLDTSGFMRLLRREGGPEVLPLRRLGLTQGQTQAAVMYATSKAVIVDQVSHVPQRGLGRELARIYGEPGIMERLPRDAWAAMSLPNVGSVGKAIFAQAAAFLPGGLGPAAANERIRRETGLDLNRDVLGWVEHAALYVSGTNRVDIGGGVLISSSDPRASRRAVHRMAGLLIAEGAAIEQRTWTWRGNVDIGNDGRDTKGYALDIGAEEPVHLVADEDRVVLAYGDEATGQAIDASSYMGDGLEWLESVKTLEKDYVPIFYVDLQSARAVLEAFGADEEDVYVEDVEPWLRPLSHVISGARRDGDRVRIRTVIGAL